MLFIGDDWAEDHHDIEIQDEAGTVLARRRLPEGVAGIGRLHALAAEHRAPDGKPDLVVVGIETDRGPWVAALVAAGYQVFAVNPVQVARYRERHSTSGAKSDAADAHTLAELVRCDRHHHRQVAGDTPAVQALQVVTRAHQRLIWARQRHVLQLRSTLREYFPAALEAFPDLDAPEALELLARAPEPALAARLSRAAIAAALRRARRRNVSERAQALQQHLGAPQLPQPPAVSAAYSVTTGATVAVIAAFNAQISVLEGEVAAHFARHPDAELYLSQPGLGVVLAARVLAEFGDDPHRYTDARCRKNYAGTSPVTRASGKKKVVLARHTGNHRLTDALHQQAFCALQASPGARTHYDQLRRRGLGHHAALRAVSNRFTGILHGCLKNHVRYDEATAWGHRLQLAA